MPWIDVIREQDAQGELKEVYKKLREQRAGERINQDRNNAERYRRTRGLLEDLLKEHIASVRSALTVRPENTAPLRDFYGIVESVLMA